MLKRLIKFRGPLVAIGCIFIFGILPVNGEDIFRWVDENGSILYSNIAPPSANIEYTKKEVSKENLLLNFNKKQSILPKLRLTRATDSEVGSNKHQTMRDVLKNNIQEKRESISIIEALLKRNPNDDTLRQNLFRKRIHLLEGINRLNSM